MAVSKRTAKRVGFDQALESVAISADGTWTIKGRVEDISATGAKFYAFGEINARMRSEEFFLVMTPDGKVKRRSKLIWEKNNRIGIGFIASTNG